MGGKKRELRDQEVIVGMAHLDPKSRMYLPKQVASEIEIKPGDKLVFLRVGGQGSEVKGVTAYPGNILISKLTNEFSRRRFKG